MKVTLRDMRSLKDGTMTTTLIVPQEDEDDFYFIRKAARQGKQVELVIVEELTKGPEISPADQLLRALKPTIEDFLAARQATPDPEVEDKTIGLFSQVATREGTIPVGSAESA